MFDFEYCCGFYKLYKHFDLIRLTMNLRTLQGIYRVSGVKSKVETLCQRFDLNPDLVELEEVHPNIISNVLKLYLRQVRIKHNLPYFINSLS